MIFVETPVFTRRITELLDEDDYFELQATLLLDPEAGIVIPGPEASARSGSQRTDTASAVAHA